MGQECIKPIENEVISIRKYDNINEREFMCYCYLYNYMRSLCRDLPLETAEISDVSDNNTFIVIDGPTNSNLDIFNNNYDNTSEKTLFKSVDFFSTPFGNRTLKKWLMFPLRSLNAINERRTIFKKFEKIDLNEIISKLKRINDIERYFGRLNNIGCSLKNLIEFKESLIKS